MPRLPTEVLQSICQYAGEPVADWWCQSLLKHDASSSITNSNASELHFSSLMAFSCSSRHFRSISSPYIFRQLKVRTIEQAALIVKSTLLNHARHLDLPAVDILTSRRPISSHLHLLLAQVTSIRISSTSPHFYYTASTPLASLLRSAKALTALELHCNPVLESVDTIPLIARLIPALPSSLRALRVTMPGGQPEYSGIETLLKAISPVHAEANQPLPQLEILYLSMHMAPLFASSPEKLAIAIAHRIPSLRYVTFEAPGRNPQRGTPLWDLISPQNGSEMYGGFKQKVMAWEFTRESGRGDGQDVEDTDSRTEPEGSYWPGNDMLY